MADFLGMDAFEDDAALADFVSDESSNDDDNNDDTNQNNDDNQNDDGQDDDNNNDADDHLNDSDDADEDDIEDKSKGSSQNTSQYSAFTTAMSESLPFLKSDEDVQINNAEEFEEYITTKINDEVQAREFADLNDLQKKYVESLRAGVPHEEIQQNLSMEEQINSISDDAIETDDKLRSNLIYQAFKQEGLSDARAQKLTKLSVDAGEDIEDAKESLATLKAGVQKQLEAKRQAGLDAQKQAKKDYEKQMQSLKDTINDPEKVLGTKKLATKYKDDLYDLITKPVKHGDKEVNFLNKYLLENPVQANIVLGHLYMATDGFKPEKISGLNGKAVKTKATKDISKIIESGNWQFGDDNESMDLSHLDNKGFDYLGDDGKLF